MTATASELAFLFRTLKAPAAARALPKLAERCGVPILVSRLRIGHFKPDSGPQRPRCRDDQPLSFSA